jgi:hypothetical protein
VTPSGAALKVEQPVGRHCGKKWHQHPYALAAFKAGVTELLSRYQLGEGIPPDTGFSGEPNDPPEVVGQTHARLIAIGTHRDNEEDVVE